MLIASLGALAPCEWRGCFGTGPTHNRSWGVSKPASAIAHDSPIFRWRVATGLQAAYHHDELAMIIYECLDKNMIDKDEHPVHTPKTDVESSGFHH